MRISRRAALAGVVAFDPVNLGWPTSADVSPCVRVPSLDGELVVDRQ
ncbi:hypothetical protein [Actinophytocola sp.]